MVAKEVFANYLNFNPIWVLHASIHVTSTGTQVKKENCQRYLEVLNLFGTGVGAGAERNIFGPLLAVNP
jgi:hypothetical protein